MTDCTSNWLTVQVTDWLTNSLAQISLTNWLTNQLYEVTNKASYLLYCFQCSFRVWLASIISSKVISTPSSPARCSKTVCQNGKHLRKMMITWANNFISNRFILLYLPDTLSNYQIIEKSNKGDNQCVEITSQIP